MQKKNRRNNKRITKSTRLRKEVRKNESKKDWKI